jgi:hypothetical protein
LLAGWLAAGDMAMLSLCAFHIHLLRFSMRNDLYLKVALTVIALALTLIACKSVVQPLGVAAQGALAGVQFSGGVGGFWAFDTKSGNIWGYELSGDASSITYLGKMVELGKPLVKETK